MKKVRVGIFASGRGSNAQKIHQYSQSEESSYEVSLIISNRKKAGILGYAKQEGLPYHKISRTSLYDTDMLLTELTEYKIDLIVLAGFLLLIPPYIIEAYPKKIINIHPALLPKYGGQGMYGMYIHEAVKSAQEKTSGITIHFADEAYDEGQVIFQTQKNIEHCYTAEEIALEVLQLEHHFYPRVIEGLSKRL